MSRINIYARFLLKLRSEIKEESLGMKHSVHVLHVNANVYTFAKNSKIT